MLKLSILDQSPVPKGGSASKALQESVKLVKLADKLGYHRYWVSEHHNTKGLAGSTPEVLLAHLAGETKNIRLGSGGIMLPNHSALKVAENFRMLEALFPGRIDLGLGRAPGGDMRTASFLNPSNTFSERDYTQQLYDLQGFLYNSREPETIHEKTIAIPYIDTAPDLWMLTSSGQSALFAAHFGMAVSFAHFINPVGGPEALEAYSAKFKPSENLQKPKVSVGIFAFCSESEEKIRQVKAVFDYQFLHLGRGNTDGFVSYEDVKNNRYTREEQQRIDFNSQRFVTGKPNEIDAAIKELAARYQTDEIMIATITTNPEDRFKSYELLAEIFL